MRSVSTSVGSTPFLRSQRAVGPDRAAEPAARAVRLHERHPRAQLDRVRDPAGPALVDRVAVVVLPQRAQQRAAGGAGRMPDDRVVAVGQARARGHAALDELEVAVLRRRSRRGRRRGRTARGGANRFAVSATPTRTWCSWSLEPSMSTSVHAVRGSLTSKRMRPASRSVPSSPASPRSSQSGSGRQSASQKASTGAEEIATARLRVAYEFVGGPSGHLHVAVRGRDPVRAAVGRPVVADARSRSPSRGSVWRSRHASSSRMSSAPLRTGVITLTLGICRDDSGAQPRRPSPTG